MKDTKLISSYIVNNKLNIELIMEEFTSYIYIINRKFDINDEDIEKNYLGCFGNIMEKIKII